MTQITKKSCLSSENNAKNGKIMKNHEIMPAKDLVL